MTADIARLGQGAFEREIIQWCVSKDETNFAESDTQFRLDVLRAKLPDGAPAFYNRNIMSRYFARTVESYSDPAYRKKQSQAIKAAIAKNGHPMKGKVHPNRGKRIASGNQAHLGKRRITDGTENRTVRIDDNFVMPVGWRFGMARRA